MRVSPVFMSSVAFILRFPFSMTGSRKILYRIHIIFSIKSPNACNFAKKYV